MPPLRWADLDVDKKALRIEWALDQTKKHGIRRKRPKTARGRRTINLSEFTVAMLLANENVTCGFVPACPTAPMSCRRWFG